MTPLMLVFGLSVLSSVLAQHFPIPSEAELKNWTAPMDGLVRKTKVSNKGDHILEYFDPETKHLTMFSTSRDGKNRLIRVTDGNNKKVYESIFREHEQVVSEFINGKLNYQEKVEAIHSGDFKVTRSTKLKNGRFRHVESISDASLFQENAEVLYMGCSYALGSTPSAELDRLLANGGRVVNFNRADDSAEGIQLGGNTTVRNCEGYAGREGRNGNLVAARDLRDAMNEGIRCFRDKARQYPNNPLSAHIGTMARIIPGLFDPSRAVGSLVIGCGSRARKETDPFRKKREFVEERNPNARIGVVAEAVTCKRWGDFDDLQPPAIAINLDKVPAPDNEANIKERKSTFFHEALHLLGITHPDKLQGPCRKGGECMDLPYYAEMCCFDNNDMACERMTTYRHGHIFKAAP